jgi:HEAT repeat protein
MEWLPRARSPRLKDTVARRLAETGKNSATAQALLREYRLVADETVKWAIADSIARVARTPDLDDLVELAADRSGGRGRQMLVYALWRSNTDRARDVILDLLDDPDVCRHAMYSLRRAFGNPEARRRIEPLLEHPNERVRESARHALKRIDRALER